MSLTQLILTYAFASSQHFYVMLHADPMSIKDTIPALQAAIQEAASGCENGEALNRFNFIGLLRLWAMAV